MDSIDLSKPRTPAARCRQHNELDIRSLVLLSLLLAAGFILNFTVGRAISSISGGLIAPEFIISAFCLTILIERPSCRQALIMGLISAAVIQITTSSPFIDFAAEGIAACIMAPIARIGMRGRVAVVTPALSTFIATTISGAIFMVIKMALIGAAGELAVVMLPVIMLTAVFNAALVAALYPAISHALATR